MLKLGTKLVCTDNPEWGTWTITKTPTPDEDWYHIQGRSGGIVMFEDELRFYTKVSDK